MKYFVTGGTGFIGSNLVKALLAAGHSVVSFDDDSRGSRWRFPEETEGLQAIRGDVRKAPDVDYAMRGCDSVIHLAYVNGTKNFYDNPSRVLEVAVKGVVNVIEAAISNGVREFVLASSSEVQQSPSVYPTPESHPLSVPDPRNPRYSYGGGKILSELMAFHYAESHFDRLLVFRPYNVYGPDMGNDHVIPELVKKIRAAELVDGRRVVEIEGDGSQTRSFCHITDAVRGIMAILEKGVHREIYNVGTDYEISIRYLAVTIAGMLSKDIHLRQGGWARGGTHRRCPDVSKLRALGWCQKMSLLDGLRESVNWYTETAV